MNIDLTEEQIANRQSAKWKTYPPDVIPAWIAEADFIVPDPVQRAMQTLVTAADYGYPRRGGRQPDDLLKDRFAHWMQRKFDWRIEPSAVRHISDLVQALYTAILAFSQPGAPVAVQVPSYPPILELVKRSGRVLRTSAMVDTGTSYGLDLPDLRAAADGGAKLLVIVNPHNPTGRVLKAAELEALARLAVERDLVVVSDEVHSDILYPGNTHLPFAKAAGGIAADRTVTITSATKGYNIAGLRCAVMHFGSPRLLETFDRTFPGRVLGTTNSFGVDATLASWSEESEPWLAAVQARLTSNRALTARLASIPGLQVYLPEGTYFCWIRCLAPLQPFGRFSQLLLERARVALSCGADFGPGYASYSRLNFATSPERVNKLVDRIGDAVASLKS